MTQIIDLNPEMTSEERIEAIARVSMKDKEHLKRWLQATNRDWLVFNTIDLVDALRWPEGVDVLMQVIACYRDHRMAQETGRFETQVDPVTRQEVDVPVFKGEALEIEEWDRLIRWAIGKALELDPRWTLDQKPM